MSESLPKIPRNPLTEFVYNVQIKTIPIKPSDKPQHIGFQWIEWISTCTKADSFGKREVVSRLATLVSPFFVSLGTIQYGCVVFGYAVTHGLGYGDPNVDLNKEVQEWVFLACGVVTSIFAAVVGVVSPSIYNRPSLEISVEARKSQEHSENFKQLQQANEKLSRELEQLKEEKSNIEQQLKELESVKGQKKKIDEELSQLKLEKEQMDTVLKEKTQELKEEKSKLEQQLKELEKVKGEKEEIDKKLLELKEEKELVDKALQEKTEAHQQVTQELEKLKQSMDRQLKLKAFELFPPVTPKTIGNECQLQGVSARSYTYEEKPKAISTWGAPTGRALEEYPEHLEEVELKNLEQFLCPEGTCEITLKKAELDEDEELQQLLLHSFLKKPHEVNRLVLHNVTPQFLLEAEKSGVLSKIHTLVLRDCEIKEAFLSALAQKYPMIACFDLRKCSIDKDPASLRKSHLLYDPNIPKKVQREGDNNIEEQFNGLNQQLLNALKKYNPKNVLAFNDCFPFLEENKLFHPAAPFVTATCFLRGTAIRNEHLKALISKMVHIFPNMRTLDLQFCQLLDSSCLGHFATLSLETLILQGCPAIFYRRVPSLDDSKKGWDLKTKYTETTRAYLVNPIQVGAQLSTLFAMGLKKLYIHDTGEKKNKEEISQAIMLGVCPIIEKVNKPPMDRGALVWYLDNQYPTNL